MKILNTSQYNEKLNASSISLDDLKDVEIDNYLDCFSFFADPKNYIDFGINKLETIRKNPNMSDEQFENFKQLYESDYDKLDHRQKNDLCTILGNILNKSDEVDTVLGNFGYEYHKANKICDSDDDIITLIYEEISPLVCIPMHRFKIYAYNEKLIKVERYTESGTFSGQSTVNSGNKYYKEQYEIIIHDILNDIHNQPWK